MTAPDPSTDVHDNLFEKIHRKSYRYVGQKQEKSLPLFKERGPGRCHIKSYRKQYPVLLHGTVITIL